MSTVSLNIKVDGDLKRQADDVFSQIGLTTSAGINVYLKKVVASRSIPFELKVDTDDEADVMQEARKLSRKALSIDASFSGAQAPASQYFRDKIGENLHGTNTGG